MLVQYCLANINYLTGLYMQALFRTYVTVIIEYILNDLSDWQVY